MVATNKNRGSYKHKARGYLVRLSHLQRTACNRCTMRLSTFEKRQASEAGHGCSKVLDHHVKGCRAAECSGAQLSPISWSHVPNKATVSYTSGTILLSFWEHFETILGPFRTILGRFRVSSKQYW